MISDITMYERVVEYWRSLQPSSSIHIKGRLWLPRAPVSLKLPHREVRWLATDTSLSKLFVC